MKTYCLLLLVFLFVGCSSGPEVRDTSKDNPKLVAEINRLASQSQSRSFSAERKFSPRRDLGWAVYKLTDRRTEPPTVSILEVQQLQGANGRRWIESRRISPTEAFVNLIEVSFVKGRTKTASGRTVDQKAERVVMWKQGDAKATEFPRDMIAASNNMANNLAPIMQDVVTPESPKRSLTVAAGKFPVCFVHNDSGVFLIKEAEETCYSSQIPAPYIVLRESESETQELLRSGWGSRKSFLPAHVKIVVDESFSLQPKRKQAE